MRQQHALTFHELREEVILWAVEESVKTERSLATNIQIEVKSEKNEIQDLIKGQAALTKLLQSKHEQQKMLIEQQQDIEAKIVLEDDCTPKFYRPRPVAYALREKVEQELDRLQRAGVISLDDSCE